MKKKCVVRSDLKSAIRQPDCVFFYHFDEKIQLREVVAEPLCEVTEKRIREALGDMKDVAVIKARLAFKTFRVVARGWRFDAERT